MTTPPPPHTKSKHTHTGGVILSGWLPLKADYPGALTDIGKSMSYFHGCGFGTSACICMYSCHVDFRLMVPQINHAFVTPPHTRHGDADGIVCYTWGKHSMERLKEMGVDKYRFETYKGLVSSKQSLNRSVPWSLHPP